MLLVTLLACRPEPECTTEDGDLDGDGTSDCADDDGDGFTEREGDCWDASGASKPQEVEESFDGLDNDCDGTVDAPGDLTGEFLCSFEWDDGSAGTSVCEVTMSLLNDRPNRVEGASICDDRPDRFDFRGTLDGETGSAAFSFTGGGETTDGTVLLRRTDATTIELEAELAEGPVTFYCDGRAAYVG